MCYHSAIGGDNLNERIKKLRKALDLTQQEFGRRIGMKQNTIALIEGGRKTSEQTIFAICREFNVNEVWLRTGEGDMFNPAPYNALDELAAQYHLTAGDRVMVEKFINLKAEHRQAILAYISEVAAALTLDGVTPEVLAFSKGVMAAEAAYAQNYGIASGTVASPTSTSADTDSENKKAAQ